MDNLAFQTRRKQQHAQKHVKKTSTVVVEKGRITKGEVVLLAILAITFFLASVFVISNYSSINSINRDIQAVQTEIDAKTRENQDLELQVTELSDPDRIFNIAKNELGLELNEENVKVITE
ncbi:cell division protein FtsL [Pueribacillus theae]|uniref:cell division protein FtsL n=1 Tax=Pueribacillus theae TaxID=2171751 RepID=UPI001402AD98|nr:cell division protein FtsL [Pueribacillus theae]